MEVSRNDEQFQQWRRGEAISTPRSRTADAKGGGGLSEVERELLSQGADARRRAKVPQTIEVGEVLPLLPRPAFSANSKNFKLSSLALSALEA
jgi:hypothetical protein